MSIPFEKGDRTAFSKVMSTEDTIHEFTPTLRTEVQARAFRVALQTLGDLCGFGINYFELENVGYVKTATEVSADNSALMRNIRRHEHALEGAIAGICRALLAVERTLGVGLPDEGEIRVGFDDSIITDTTAEKRQDMDEVAAGLMQGWEYRAKWYGEDEATARRRGAAAGSGVSDGGSEHVDAARAGVPAHAFRLPCLGGRGRLGSGRPRCRRRRLRGCRGLRSPWGSGAPLTSAWRPCGSPGATSPRSRARCSSVRAARTSTPHHHPRRRAREQQPICRSGVRAAARNRPDLRTSNSQQAMPRAAKQYTAGAAGMAVSGAFRAGRGGFRAVRATERRRVGCGRPPTTSGRWWGVALGVVV